MTKKLEEAFDLRPIKEVLGEDNDCDESISTEVATKVVTALSTAEKIDHALSLVNDIEDHDKEMDQIAEEALASYLEFKELGAEQSDAHSARMMEVAANMLKTAMKAKAQKATRKLKTLELQLKKLKLEQDLKKNKRTPASTEEDGYEFDRNELLRHIRDQK